MGVVTVEPVRVELTDAAFGGESLGRLPDGRVVFVPRTLPGEEALVHVQQTRKDFARADVFEIERAASGRVAPPCPYFSAGCGGCSWQHADYALQLQLKYQIVVDQLRRVGRFESAEDLVREPIGMLDPWHYRNQARFTVGRRFGELCFTYRGSHRLMRIDHCWIVHPRINDTLEQLQTSGRLTQRRLHQVLIRVGSNTDQLLVAPSLPEAPEVPSGQPFVDEELLGRRFRLQPPSFFQVNTRREQRALPNAVRTARVPLPTAGLSMADILALLVLDRSELQPDSLVVDAYSGVGTFALLVAPLVRDVIAIEEARSAVRDARANAADLPNVRFIEAKTEHALPSLDDRPDTVILDPARAGCHPDVLSALLGSRPNRIVYVSCDPSTLARDLRVLVEAGYTLDEVQPVNMFPQTYHIENVATLKR
ncbi:MAG: class I SAM-dependent RNA methyltransferase [Chloroflexi bacterium]|nr:class I SAM-dependent RNA methyltransferase [Chloroflexota bacterium]